MNSKSLFASKTFWVNAIAMLITILTALSGQEFLTAYPQVAQAFVLIVSMLNVWLRYLTDTPVHVSNATRTK